MLDGEGAIVGEVTAVGEGDAAGSCLKQAVAVGCSAEATLRFSLLGQNGGSRRVAYFRAGHKDLEPSRKALSRPVIVPVENTSAAKAKTLTSDFGIGSE